MQRFTLTASLILLMGLSSLLAPDTAKAFTLTLLQNNDAESKLLPRDSAGQIGGAAQFTALINHLKASATTDAVITLSAGDNIIPGLEFNASQNNGVFYDALTFDAIGYDAMALGNHDFDLGPDVLADLISSTKTNIPFLAANLDYSNEPRLQTLFAQGRLARSVVVDKGGERIGVIGAITPDLPLISSPRNVIVNSDVRGAVQAEIDTLESQGVNKIILATQLQTINNDIALAQQLRGIDIIISGGGQELLANPGDPLLPSQTGTPFGSYPITTTNGDGDTIPIVTTTGEYRYVGKLEVEFDANGKVVSFQGGPVRVFAGDGITPDPTIQTEVVDPVQAAVNALAQNVIAVSEAPLDGTRNSVRTKETNLGNLIADSLLWNATNLAPQFGVDTPTVALQNGGGIRVNKILPAGDFTEKDTFDTLPFSNFVTIVPNITAITFKQLLENAVSNIANVDGRFAQISGFVFSYDPTLEVGKRVNNVILNDGTVLVKDGDILPGTPSISIATIDFLARGGDSYPYGGVPFTNLGLTYQLALENYVKEALNGQITGERYAAGVNDRIFINKIPDDKVPQPQSVPEPVSVIGLLIGALGAGSLLKRKNGSSD